MMTFILLFCQLFLILVLLSAAISKLVYPQHFVTALRISPVPQFLVHPLAVLIVISEMELAMGLAFSSSQLLPIFFLGTFLLLIFFICWLVFIYRRGLSVSCGCFGANSSLVNKMDIIRNIIFMGITMIGFFATRVTTNILFPSSPWILIVEIGLAMGIMVLYLLRYQSIHPKISSATNGPPIGIAMMRKHPRTSLASKQ